MMIKESLPEGTTIKVDLNDNKDLILRLLNLRLNLTKY